MEQFASFVILLIIIVYCFLHVVWLKACNYKHIPVICSIIMSSAYMLFFLLTKFLKAANLILSVTIIISILAMQTVYAILKKNGKALRAIAGLYFFNSLLGWWIVFVAQGVGSLSLSTLVLSLLFLPGLFFLFYASRFSGI